MKVLIMVPEIWKDGENGYRAYTEDRKLKDQLSSWKGCEIAGVYYYQKEGVSAWDVVLPTRNLRDRAAKHLGLPTIGKSKNRVIAGKRNSKNLKQGNPKKGVILPGSKGLKCLINQKIFTLGMLIPLNQRKANLRNQPREFQESRLGGFYGDNKKQN